MERSAASNTLRRGQAEALAPRTASRRRCYNQAAHRGQGFADHGCASGATRASTGSPAASERHPEVERDRPARRCGSGAKATGREWRKESAPAGARQGRRCRDRRACDRERSWRMVVLGRRIARGGRERGAKPSPPATRAGAAVGAKHRSDGRSRSRYLADDVHKKLDELNSKAAGQVLAIRTELNAAAEAPTRSDRIRVSRGLRRGVSGRLGSKRRRESKPKRTGPRS